MNSPMSCPFAPDPAAYVIGALSPAERLEFERHLGECDDCTRAIRELAGIPGLLGRVEPSVLEHPVADGSVPDTLLPSLSRRVRDVRRRRAIIAAGVAAAAMAVLVPVAVSQVGAGDRPRPEVPVPSSEPPAVAAEPMAPVGDVPLEASVTLESVTWGTRLGLTSTYDRNSMDRRLPPSMDYTLCVRTWDGRLEKVGSWKSVSGMEMQISGATAARREEISWVLVRAPDGRVVLKLPG
ncbi:MAG: anti-sigma factor family protein [Nocardioides sp.]